jgi:hypothetical protein
LIRNSSIDEGGTIANKVLEIIHRVDLLLKELLPQDKDSKRLAKIHLEVLLLMFSLML